MARNADQIVAEQLGALHLQFVLAVARAEAAEEKVAELTAQVNALSAFKKDVFKVPDENEVPDEKAANVPEVSKAPKR